MQDTAAIRPIALNQRGVTLALRGQLDEAAACFRAVLDIRPDFQQAHNNLAMVLRRLGQLDQAIVNYRQAISLQPDFVEAHYNLALALLKQGDLTAGWIEYEWRWQTPQLRKDRRDYSLPLWRGESAAGRTLLIHAEQGLGDTLHFCRYAPMAAARGLRVMFEAPRPLVRLLRSLAWVDRVVEPGADRPAADLHCPVMSLPLAFGTTLATIPASASYLHADPAMAAAWGKRLGSVGPGLRVGLVWSGNPLPTADRRRAVPPERLAPLFELTGVQFFSLQKSGPPAPAGFPLIDLMGEVDDFADTAALVANLDLVVTVDTAVAHLAAALGKPVWLLAQFDLCWRWLDGRRDSPWYPGLRIYRQPAPADWEAVVAEVADDLRRHPQRGSAPRPALRPVPYADTVAAPDRTGLPMAMAMAMPTPDQQLQQGLEHHRAGRLAEAASVYHALLAADPRDADALHLLGVLADARGDSGRGVELIGQALRIRESPRFHSNLGMALGRLGRHNEALTAYQRALALRPDYPEALNNLGITLEALDRPTEAVDAFRRALALRPEQAEWWSNLGNALRTMRQTDAAEAAYRRAVELSPALPRAHAQLGQVLRDGNRPAAAEAAFRRQMALNPDDPDAHINLAAALGEQDRAAEAVAILPQAIALAPERPEAHHNLATALRQLGRLEEAEAAARCAVELRPDYADALGNLGNILREQGRLEAAEPIQRRALALRPAAARGYNDLAIVLADQGRLHEALAVLDLAAALDPADTDTRHHRAFCLLLQARLMEGWAEYEVRFDTKQGRADRRGFTQPQWRGEPLAGRTVLLHAEQGLGDTLQFCRYAALVAARGGRVVLEVQPALRGLLGSLAGVTQLLVQGDKLPAFDLHCALLSLPLAFATEAGTVPGGLVPYLAPPAEALARWARRLPPAGGRRAGVVWAGNPRHINDRRRSLPFDVLAPLWAVPEVSWVSLQMGPPAAALAAAPPGVIEDLAPELLDFTDTAAAICQLDVVVTADTAVAHLAGALGRPAFVMLPFAPDWRWLRRGERSAWYPSLRLFRQDAQRRWPPVIEAVAEALHQRP